MKLFKLKKAFEKDESGAVTVDWVVLTAAVVGLALLVLTFVRDGLNTAGQAIQDELNEAINFADG